MNKNAKRFQSIPQDKLPVKVTETFFNIHKFLNKLILLKSKKDLFELERLKNVITDNLKFQIKSGLKIKSVKYLKQIISFKTKLNFIKSL